MGSYRILALSRSKMSVASSDTVPDTVPDTGNSGFAPNIAEFDLNAEQTLDYNILENNAEQTLDYNIGETDLQSITSQEFLDKLAGQTLDKYIAQFDSVEHQWDLHKYRLWLLFVNREKSPEHQIQVSLWYFDARMRRKEWRKNYLVWLKGAHDDDLAEVWDWWVFDERQYEASWDENKNKIQKTWGRQMMKGNCEGLDRSGCTFIEGLSAYH